MYSLGQLTIRPEEFLTIGGKRARSRCSGRIRALIADRMEVRILLDFVYEKGPEFSEPFNFGGGENRTLVLSKQKPTMTTCLEPFGKISPAARFRH